MVLVYYSTPSRVRPVTSHADNAQANRWVGIFTMHNAATGHGIRPINHRSIVLGPTSWSCLSASTFEYHQRCYSGVFPSPRKPDASVYQHTSA